MSSLSEKRAKRPKIPAWVFDYGSVPPAPCYDLNGDAFGELTKEEFEQKLSKSRKHPLVRPILMTFWHASAAEMKDATGFLQEAAVQVARHHLSQILEGIEYSGTPSQLADVKVHRIKGSSWVLLDARYPVIRKALLEQKSVYMTKWSKKYPLVNSMS